MFTPFRLRDLLLTNRVVVSPMCQYVAEDGMPDEWHLVHLGSRAIGGGGPAFRQLPEGSRGGGAPPRRSGPVKPRDLVPPPRHPGLVPPRRGAPNRRSARLA